MKYAKIVSEKGGRLSVVYPEKTFTAALNGKAAGLGTEDLLSGIETVPGDVVEIYTKTK